MRIEGPIPTRNKLLNTVKYIDKAEIKEADKAIDGIAERDIDCRIKICIVGSSSRFFSGLTTHTVLLANALAKNNQVSVILLRNLVPRFLYPGRRHIGQISSLVDFHPDIDVYEGMDWNSPMSWWGAYKFLKEHRSDVMIMQWWSSSVAHMELFLAIANRVRLKAKMILEMHEVVDPLEESILPIKLYSRIAGKLIMGRADVFTTHSTSAKRQVAQIYGFDKRSIFVVPMGLYEDYKLTADVELSRSELGINKEFVILYFGLIRKYKGVPFLIEAFNKLPSHIAGKSKLIIVGEEWGDDVSISKMIESSPYREQIIYRLQFVPDEMISKYFSVANVIALPYLRTAGSGVANIAMTYGKPIISSAIEAMRECLTGYDGALFTPPGDSAAITEKLIGVYNKHKLGTPMEYSLPGNTWDEVARQYEVMMKQFGVVK